MNHKCLRKRQLCTDCGLLLLPGEAEQHEGQGHNIVTGIKNVQLKHPTELFTPLDDNKTFAQYLFSPNTVEFVLETLTAQKATHVLCIGCPRIHEAIQCIKDGSMDSLLMDLDHRYLQMYSPKKLLQYNMLNHHFFAGETDRSTYEGFLGAGKVAVVIDPPFGIMVEALSHTLDRLQQDWRAHADLPGTGEETKLPVFWFFPYFMEQRVIDTCPTLAMLDYKVDYVNHALFRGEGGRKKGSPVRIFTNIPAKQITLPADEGYWYCGDCERFSSLENKHCDLCKACTTKDGCTYRHCDRCGRCVKPSRVHCDTCNKREEKDENRHEGKQQR
ncbi:ZCHC4-like protein [Mya arenaria]|uniref:ZCHC4-like protein n=1 Tax=Mya arenaria TaxID=6604 RepID=A0ABY7DVW1_MYAAR|nr:ZCHC4-like protein [Mya arenaria]